MTARRGRPFVAALALFAANCDRTLTFDSGMAEPAGHAGAEPGSGGINAGGAGSGAVSGGSGSAGLGEGGVPTEPPPWTRGGTSGDQPPPPDGPPPVNPECVPMCASVGLFCLDFWQTCVECLRDDDCAPRGLRCDRKLNRCVACSANAGCDNGRVCDGWSGLCVESCATESHPERACREQGQMCDEGRNVCVSCRDDGDCLDDGAGPHCLPGGARCAECVADADCRADAPYCNPVGFECVVCRDSRDCQVPTICHPQAHVCADPRLDWPFPPGPAPF